MMPCERPDTPDVLVQVAEPATQRWLDRLERRQEANGAGAKPVFQWPQRDGRPINQSLLPHLEEMTDAHCSYCDSFPIRTQSAQTIDHFKPKSRYPHLVLDWDNLFLCCSYCQGLKAEQFAQTLLKPDVEGYTFERYFSYHYGTGEIRPNPEADEQDQARARDTIRILGLNQGDRPFHRQLELKKMRFGAVHKGPTIPLKHLPYRFIYKDNAP